MFKLSDEIDNFELFEGVKRLKEAFTSKAEGIIFKYLMGFEEFLDNVTRYQPNTAMSSMMKKNNGIAVIKNRLIDKRFLDKVFSHEIQGFGDLVDHRKMRLYSEARGAHAAAIRKHVRVCTGANSCIFEILHALNPNRKWVRAGSRIVAYYYDNTTEDYHYFDFGGFF